MVGFIDLRENGHWPVILRLFRRVFYHCSPQLK